MTNLVVHTVTTRFWRVNLCPWTTSQIFSLTWYTMLILLSGKPYRLAPYLTLGMSVKWLSQRNLTIQFDPWYSLVICMTVFWVSRITLNSLFHSHVNLMHPVQPCLSSSIPLPSHRLIKNHHLHVFLPPIYVTLIYSASFALEYNFWSGTQKTHF